jgi:peptidoglycan hydrolase CwlO-like protein
MSEKRNNKKILYGGGVGVVAIITIIILILNFMGTSEDRLNAKIENNRVVVTLQGKVGTLEDNQKEIKDALEKINDNIEELRKEIQNRNRGGGG